MALKQVLDVYEILDDIHVNGEVVTEYAKSKGILDATYTRVDEGKGPTDFIRLVIPGRNGKLNGGKAPTLGIIGQLGGIGARPERIGFVSDGDGALSAVATAIKLIDMVGKGDQIDGDVIVSTHICPTAPTMPHDPVPFMGSPVDMATNVKLTVDPDMDAILSVDTTKGNRILNKRIRADSYRQSRLYSAYQRRSPADPADFYRRTPMRAGSDNAGYNTIWQWALSYEQHSSALLRDGCSGRRCGNHDGIFCTGMCNRSNSRS